MPTKEAMMAEARRCLQCKDAPCTKACPAHNPIPAFMKAVRDGDFSAAKALWESTSVLPEICGRLCQNENLCVGHCTMNRLKAPLKIGDLEAGVADLFSEDIPLRAPSNGRRHLVVGLGPAGLANALEMARHGYFVETIDSNSKLGGALRTQIPEFRFDPSVLSVYERRLEALGVVSRWNTVVGRDLFLGDLLPDFDSVFLACGSDLPQISDLDSSGVPLWYAHDLLNRNLHSPEELRSLLGQDVVVIGLGNVAVDIARLLIRLGKRVTIVYRRSVEEAPAGKSEIESALAEGVVIRELRVPRECRLEKGRRSLECDRTAVLLRPDGTRAIETVPGFAETLALDDLVFATGQRSSDLVLTGTDILPRPDLCLYSTTHPRVFLGGDRVNPDKRIVDAMASGIEAARLCRGVCR